VASDFGFVLRFSAFHLFIENSQKYLMVNNFLAELLKELPVPSPSLFRF
jgi:hypothetical protein